MAAFSHHDVFIDIADADGVVTLITIDTPVGRCEMLGQVRMVGQVLHVDKAHVGGLEPGRLGRSGISAILKRLLVDANVERLVIQGETRTTGRYVGKRPRRVVFPR